LEAASRSKRRLEEKNNLKRDWGGPTSARVQGRLGREAVSVGILGWCGASQGTGCGLVVVWELGIVVWR
jgi:hypothetical protein